MEGAGVTFGETDIHIFDAKENESPMVARRSGFEETSRNVHEMQSSVAQMDTQLARLSVLSTNISQEFGTMKVARFISFFFSFSPFPLCVHKTEKVWKPSRGGRSEPKKKINFASGHGSGRTV